MTTAPLCKTVSRFNTERARRRSRRRGRRGRAACYHRRDVGHVAESDTPGRPAPAIGQPSAAIRSRGILCEVRAFFRRRGTLRALAHRPSRPRRSTGVTPRSRTSCRIHRISSPSFAGQHRRQAGCDCIRLRLGADHGDVEAVERAAALLIHRAPAMPLPTTTSGARIAMRSLGRCAAAIGFGDHVVGQHPVGARPGRREFGRPFGAEAAFQRPQQRLATGG